LWKKVKKFLNGYFTMGIRCAIVSKNTAKTPFPRFDGGGTCPGAACGEYL
jgi:hypothetical protein